MQNKLALIAGGLLGLVFVVFGLNFFIGFLDTPSPAPDTPAAAFMGAIYSTGFLTFVKVLEIVGGVLVAIPKTRNFGLLILGPIVLNILVYNVLIAPGGWMQPPVILISVLSGFLLWTAKDKFAQLQN